MLRKEHRILRGRTVLAMSAALGAALLLSACWGWGWGHHGYHDPDRHHRGGGPGYDERYDRPYNAPCTEDDPSPRCQDA